MALKGTNGTGLNNILKYHTVLMISILYSRSSRLIRLEPRLSWLENSETLWKRLGTYRLKVGGICMERSLNRNLDFQIFERILSICILNSG